MLKSESLVSVLLLTVESAYRTAFRKKLQCSTGSHFAVVVAALVTVVHRVQIVATAVVMLLLRYIGSMFPGFEIRFRQIGAGRPGVKVLFVQRSEIVKRHSRPTRVVTIHAKTYNKASLNGFS